MRREPTFESLKALPLTKRYDAFRELFEKGRGVQHYMMTDAFQKLCLRKTWPKDRKFTGVGFGRANRWNFNPMHDHNNREVPFRLPATLPDSPKALYRLLHVIEPTKIHSKHDDYYQGGIFRFFSPDRRFMCWVAFQKHELELNFYCPRADLFIPTDPELPEPLRGNPTTQEEFEEWFRPETGGWATMMKDPVNQALFDEYRKAQDAYNDQGIVVPWCSERMRCKSPSGQAWMQLIVKVANTKHMLYGGNSFAV